MATINRESTIDAPAPESKVKRILENEFVLLAINKSGSLIVAKMIYDLYCLENTRCQYSNLPQKDLEQWVKDPRFSSQIVPYGLEEIARLVRQLAGNPE